MMERPSFSSSLAREKTASAPSPFSCETRDAIRLMVSGRILSFCGGQRSDWDVQAVDEAREHLEGRGGEKELHEFLVVEGRLQLGVKGVVDILWAAVQAVREAEAEFLLSAVRAVFEIGDAFDLLFGGAFFSSRSIMRGNRVFGHHQPRDTHRDQLL